MIPALRALLALAFILLAPLAQAQTFPKFDDSGVVDAAGLLTPAQVQALSQKLIAQKKASGRSVVVATIPDLQGYDISDYGYRLLRAWGVGSKEKNDGALLIVAPNDRKVRIEVGYGLEGMLTDALSSQIIRNTITPAFKAGDFAGGINAGTDQIARILALPPEEAQALARKAAEEEKNQGGDAANFFVIFWVAVIFIIVFSGFFSRGGGRRHRRGAGPVIIWGPGMGGGWGSGGGSDWGGGGGWGGGGDGGGFSGGGSGGGGGASGGW
jgi:uncharacterized protein